MAKIYDSATKNEATPADIRTAMSYVEVETVDQLMAFCNKFGLSPTTIARIAHVKHREVAPWNERHPEVFDTLDPHAYSDMAGLITTMSAGDEPTREEMIACRLLTGLIFDEDQFGGIVADYPTLLKLAEAMGEDLLNGLDNLIELVEYFRDRAEVES